MARDNFVHLHNHTHYSYLDGHSLIKDMVHRVKELGQPAVAAADHGNMHSVYELQKISKEAGIQPIFGVEAYMAPTNGANRFTRERVFYGRNTNDAVEGAEDVSGGGAYTHITLLARSNEGLQNLFQFNYRSFTEGFYRKNRADLELLSMYGKGIIATSGCPSGEIQTRLRLGQMKEALEYASQVQDIVGKENYFVELMNHEMSIGLERDMIPHLIEFAKKIGAPLVVTNDSHYVNHKDHTAHERMLAMQTGAAMSEPPTSEGGRRFSFSGEGYYLKSRAEMERVFPPSEFKEALDNTLLIAEMAQGVSIEYNDALRPQVELPEGKSVEDHFMDVFNEGIISRYGEILPEHEERRDLECSVIIPKNYAHYFLVTADFVQWAKDNGVYVGPGRGCLAADTKVLTPLGFKNIKDIQKGDEVFDQNGDIVAIPNKMQYDCDEELIQITSFSSPFANKMTFDHKVLVQKKGDVKTDWVRADEVEAGDFVVLPRFKFPERYNLDPAMSNGYEDGLKMRDTLKRVPEEVMHSPSSYVEDFLSGLLHNDWREGDAWHFETRDEATAHQIHMLFLSIDVPAVIKKHDDSYIVETFSPELMSDNVAIYDDFIHYRVTDVKIVPSEGKVYDFTVPTTNSYVTSSSVVHNSAGGSLAAFCLGITELDPLRHDLLFERFLNPERDSPPDIDMDFDDQNRDRVIEYVTEKYGKDNVANIITFTKLGVKQGIKDSAKILSYPYSLGDTLNKKVPPADAGHEMTFKQLYDPNEKRYPEAHDFREIVKELNAEEVIEVAKSIEGRVRGTGVHAAGILISSDKIINHIPLMMRQKDGTIITQLDYPTCEALGLIKMDFLGLRNLTIIKDAINHIKRTRGVEIDMSEIFHGPMDEPKVYKMLAAGDSLGIFQLDGGGMRELLKRLAPTSLDDISAVLALYRPGPMGMESHTHYADRKNGREPVADIHPELTEPLKDILEPTYGLCIFQEQVMQIAQRVAGYSLAQADNLRRAMGKKKKEVLDQEYIPFAEGMKSNGFSEEAVQTLWQTLLPFAEYGFNKSHSVGYALISYVTAYLKALYPVEYMSALIHSVRNDKTKIATYLHECKRMGIRVIVPDINTAQVETAPLDSQTIVLGLTLTGMSTERAQNIVESRRGAPFVNLNDFIQKVNSDVLNKSLLEKLVLGGAFDSFGHTRRGLMAIISDVAADGRKTKRQEDSGQFSLFEEDEDNSALFDIGVPDIPEFPKTELLSAERSVLGLYVSDHPLSKLEDVLESESDTLVSELLTRTATVIEGFPDADTPRQTIAGVISEIDVKRSKKTGDEFAIVTIEDLTGSIDATLFSRTWTKFGGMLKKDHVYVFTGLGRAREAEDTPTFGIDNVTEIEMTADGRVPFKISVDHSQINEASLTDLHQTLLKHSGESPVALVVSNKMNRSEVWLSDEYNVKPSRELKDMIRWFFGQYAI